MQTFNLFVYGTLMRGFQSHRLIPENSKMTKGKIAGNLYHYCAGYPVAKILRHPDSVEGSYNYQKDIEIQNDRNRVEPACLPLNLKFGKVFGELYEIPYTGDNNIFKMLDNYEGFDPNSNDRLYNRTLVPVQTENRIIWAWVYNMEEAPSSSVHILSGNWLDCFYSNGGGLRPEINKAISSYYESAW